MRLHTNLTADNIRTCLDQAKAGDIPSDIVFDVFGETGSRSHPHGFEVHLASTQKNTRDDGVTRRTNPMARHDGPRYAASYDEWGWFLAELFAADRAAKAGPYKNEDDFHVKTRHAYTPMGRAQLPPDHAGDLEPARAEPDTEPVSDARLPVIERIDAVLADYPPDPVVFGSSPAHLSLRPRMPV
jgi:uncharacterized protein YwbE